VRWKLDNVIEIIKSWKQCALFRQSMPATVYNCIFCPFRSKDGIELVEHVFEAHSFETNFCYECGISCCTRVFTPGSSFDAFHSHCNRKHHDWQCNFIPNLEDPAVMIDRSTTSTPTPAMRETSCSGDTQDDTDEPEDESNTDVGLVDFNVCNDASEDLVEEHDAEQSTSYGYKAVKIAAAKFILTLKEKFKLTQTSLDYTVKAVEELVVLSSECVEQSDPGLAGSLHPSPFDELKTEHQQTKFFEENFGLIVSGYVCRIFVGSLFVE